MDFSDALKAMKEGKKVRHPGMSKGTYYLSDGTKIKYAASDRNIITAMPSNFEVMKDDWEVVE